ncbi:MAG: chemotaxis protein CheW [Candidatus Caldatribacterium sp.]|nr:chemotaxis protein CheW [Candidatus Caldatribacterium sp.]
MVTTSETKYVTFAIAGEMYAVPVHLVREIVRPPKVTRIPLVPEHILGVANLRGEVLPIMSLRRRLGLPEEDLETSKIVVLHSQERILGIVVDRTAQVIQVTEDQIESAATSSEFVQKVIRTGDALEMVLEVEKFFGSGEEGEARWDRFQGTRETEKKTKEKVTEEHLQIVTFALENEEYAFPIEEVQEIIRYSKPTEVPDVPPYVKGVTHLRNAVLPIIDLRTMLGLPVSPIDEFTKVIVLRLKEKWLGLVVDRIHEVLRIQKSEIQKPPAFVEQSERGEISGIVRRGDRTIMVLKAASLFAEEIASLGGGEEKEEVTSARQESEMQYIVFRVDEEHYGVPIEEVREINRVATITRIPKSPEFLEGVMNLRGEVIPIVDLRKRFGLPQAIRNELTRIIVVEVGGGKTGFIVDAVEGVEKIPESAIAPVPDAVRSGEAGRFVERIAQKGEEVILILNMTRILTEEETQLMEEAVTKGTREGNHKKATGKKGLKRALDTE